jgi:glyoxylate reductase
MKKIYMTRPIHDAGIALLKGKGYEVIVGEGAGVPSHEGIIEALQATPYDAVVAFLTDKVDATLFDACPTAKIFSNYSVGFNNVDLAEAERRGIAITNTPGTSGLAVAEHAVALMLACTTRLAEGDRFMRSGTFAGWQPDLFLGTDLSGKTVGLIGTGDIGARVAKMLSRGFGCKIVYNDVVRNQELETVDAATYMERDELLRTADIVTLHVPLLPATMHLIDAAAFASMKPSAILINTARGPIIDEAALVEALKNRTISAAGLDVYEFEPKVTDELLQLDNVVLTPHIASSRETARIKMAETVANNIISFFETGTPLTPVVTMAAPVAEGTPSAVR